VYKKYIRHFANISIFYTFRLGNREQKMAKNTQLKTQRFDTIHLSVPASAITPNLSNYSYTQQFNAETQELVGDDDLMYQNRFIGNIAGLSHIVQVPHRDLFDIRFSAKILREQYPEGITSDTIVRVISELEKGGVGSIDISDFILNSQVRVCDNTFNIQIDNGEIKNYLDAIDLVAVQGKKGKHQTYYGDNTKGKEVDSVIIGKNTNKLQKITLYNKIEECRANADKKKIEYKTFSEIEYGMQWPDFYDYFNNKLRVELRVSNQEHMRRFYQPTYRSNQKMTLEGILLSKENAILHQWDNFINEKLSVKAMNYLDMTYRERQQYKINGFSAAANWALIGQFVKMFDGDEVLVKDKIEKLYYTPFGKNRISPSVLQDIHNFCKEHKMSKIPASNGNNITEKYKEVKHKISNL
jgi:hypothetical protein